MMILIKSLKKGYFFYQQQDLHCKTMEKLYDEEKFSSSLILQKQRKGELHGKDNIELYRQF